MIIMGEEPLARNQAVNFSKFIASEPASPLLECPVGQRHVK